ncbi:MAG: hypothetical protein R3C02_04810 [Planctomycetaceae bacterium]
MNERRIVNNRVFLLGLDELYREASEQHERNELYSVPKTPLLLFRLLSRQMSPSKATTENEELTEYFRLVRALQRVPKHRESELDSLDEFARLKLVTESRIFGPSSRWQFLLPVGKRLLIRCTDENFSRLEHRKPNERRIRVRLNSDDFSLIAPGCTVT